MLKTKKIIAVLLSIVVCISSNVVDTYAMSCTGKKACKDTDTSFSTLGTYQDSTNLDINFIEYWWYAKATIKSDGVAKFTFDKKSTNYTYEFLGQTLTFYMSGIGMEATVGTGGSSVKLTNSGNSASYTTDAEYFSYSVKMSSRCWVDYEQNGSAKYKIKDGIKVKGEVLLLTSIEW